MRHSSARSSAIALPALSGLAICLVMCGCGFGDRFTHSGFDGSFGIDSSTGADAGTDSSIPGCPNPPPGDLDCDGVDDAMDCAPLEPALSLWMLQDELDDLSSLTVINCTWNATGGFADVADMYPCGVGADTEWAFALVNGVPLADVRAETRFRFDGGSGPRFVGVALEADGALRSGYFCEVHNDGRLTLQQRESIASVTSLGTDASFDSGGNFEGDEIIDLSVIRIGSELTCTATFPGGQVSSITATAPLPLSGQVALTSNSAPADFDFIYVCGP